MSITVEQFKTVFGGFDGCEEVVDALNAAMALNGIDTKDRVCGFLSQAGHESGHFKIKVENLNYSQQGLRKVFPKYFPDDATAFRYARQPAAIANRVYGGRMGNGNEQSGDGFKYRGRGYIMCTGKNNYKMCSQYMFGDDRLLQTPELLEETSGAVQSAVWFWVTNNLNALADKKDVLGMTKRINGGTIGLADRQSLYKKLQEVL